MTKHLLPCILLLFLIPIAIQDQVKPYKAQDQIPLVTDITSFGFSPDQKNLIALTSTGANNTFIFYSGLRLLNKITVSIVDTDPFNVKPSAFAFSPDGKWLIVGTSSGSVYGYQITESQIADNYRLKKNIQTAQVEDGIKSISFSAGGLIAVAAKDKFVVLKVPDIIEQKTQFEVEKQKKLDGVLSSVAWKLHSDAIVIVGGYDAISYFHLYNIETESFTPIETTTTSKTTSIGVFPDNDQTIVQGIFDKDIEVYKWDDGASNYVRVDTIPETTYAEKITITKDGLYFSAVIKSQNKVRAWKSGLVINHESNLKNNLQSITVTDYLNQPGQNLALTSNGNSILVIDPTNKITRWNLCQRKFYYNTTTMDCQQCPTTCGQCFDLLNCNTCPDNTRYIDNSNVCQPCSNTVDGCEKCLLDSGACTDCNQTQHFKPAPENNVCKCDSTFYPLDKSCAPCSSIKYCYLCSVGDRCETCVQTDHIAKKPVNGQCKCVDGWYFDGQKVCQECNIAIKGCKICQSDTQCTTCDQDKNWIPDGNGKCICGTGFWQDGTECKPCSSKTTYCSTCQQNGTCKTCSATRTFNAQKTQCVCQDHTYEDPTNQQCLPCQTQGCLHCQVNTPHTCTQCDTKQHHLKDPVGGKCLCEAGYIQDDVSFKCIRCAITGCKDCQVLDTCSECFEEKNFNLQPVNLKCQCKEGYKPDPDTAGQQCLTCGQKIAGCIQCQDLTQCQACNSTANFISQPNTQSHKCDCQAQYFLTQQSSCKLCSQEYAGCQNCDNTKCLTCKSSYYPTDNNKSCLTCAQAITGCVKCNDVHKCLDCSTDQNWQLDADTGLCVCREAFYKNGTECKYCGVQYPYCSNCTMEGCNSCQNTFFYNKDLKICYCPDDKQVKDGKCQDKSGLSALAIIAIIVGILAVAGAAVAIIKCFKKRQSPLEDGEYEALQAEKNQ